MRLHGTRVVAAGLIVVSALGAPSAQVAQLPSQPEATQESEFADDLQRLLPTLDAVEDFEKLLKGIEVMRTELSACTPDGSATSLGEALMWSVDSSLQADRELTRGRAAIDACRLSTAEDALENLTLQSSQVTQLVNVFSALPPTTAPLEALDRTLDQTRWVAMLRSDAVELTDLARELEQALAQDPSYETRLAQARRLIEISSRADDLLRETLSCTIASQPLAAANRIVATVQPVSSARLELETAFNASKTTTCAAAVVATKPAGPSWLPPPANAAVKQAPVAVPSWVPDRDTPATLTTTTRSADMVGEVRDRLITEETERIEEQSRRYADARAQRATDAQRTQLAAQTAPVGQTAAVATPAVLRGPVGHSQALAMAQRQVSQQIQQRERRRTSFLGVLGKVTAVVGAVAATVATAGVASPALAAVLPAVTAVGAVAQAAQGGVGSLLTASLGLPVPPSAQQALAVARAAANAATGGAVPAIPSAAVTIPGAPYNPQTGAYIPQSGAYIPQGGPTGYLPPTVNEPYLGKWNCTATNTRTERDGSRSNFSNPAVLELADSNGRLVLSTEAGAIAGTVVGGRAQFDHTLPPDFGSCQMRILLTPQGGQLTGNSTASCPTGEQMTGVLVCQR